MDFPLHEEFHPINEHLISLDDARVHTEQDLFALGLIFAFTMRKAPSMWLLQYGLSPFVDPRSNGKG